MQLFDAKLAFWKQYYRLRVPQFMIQIQKHTPRHKRVHNAEKADQKIFILFL